MRTLTILIACVLIACAAGASANSVARPAGGSDGYPVFPVPDLSGMDPGEAERIRRGEYLAKMADCLACHTNELAMDPVFAGGLAFKTPFGTLYSPNITPDESTGIGAWTDEDFVRAVREGIRPDGSYYYPVFPYNYFARMSRDDVLAVKAFLDTVPAVKQSNREPDMSWPFNLRFLQLGWRLLYFDFEDHGFEADAGRSERWNRGAFIVKGPGHCALCHTELNLFGVPRHQYYLAGAFVENYYAPDITARGLAGLDDAAVARIFATGARPTGGELSGPMGDVEHNSLRYLKAEDRLAIGDYLKSVHSASPPVEDVGGEALDTAAGKRLYQSTCRVCHSVKVIGAPELTDRRAWEVLLDQGRERLYEVAIRGSGEMPPKGGCPMCSDARIKAAVDYMIETALGTE